MPRFNRFICRLFGHNDKLAWHPSGSLILCIRCGRPYRRILR